ncbi:MAG: hypothetical protein ACE15F_15840 [bacterium]
MKYRAGLLIWSLWLCGVSGLVAAQPLEGTAPLTEEGDFAARMVTGIDQYLLRLTEETAANRARQWQRDFSSPEKYGGSLEPCRKQLRAILGVVDERDPVRAELVRPMVVSDSDSSHLNAIAVAEGANYTVYSIRWTVFRGVQGEGLLLEPRGRPRANVVALPDCDWTPEMLCGLMPGIPEAAQFARRLADNGCRVVVPCLIGRSPEGSGIPGGRPSRLPKREFLWRAFYEMGRTMAGYEMQKTMAVMDWFAAMDSSTPIGLFGYGEGGMIAFYTSAVDARVRATAVSGYYQPREGLWEEPIYRNTWSLLTQFGDAETAGLVAPRPLIIESGAYPQVVHPTPGDPQPDGTAPGELRIPDPDQVKHEVARAREWVKDMQPAARIHWVEGRPDEIGKEETLTLFLRELGIEEPLRVEGRPPRIPRPGVNPEERARRQYAQLYEDGQALTRDSEFVREKFWAAADRSSRDAFVKSSAWYREYFKNEIIGQLPEPSLPPNPRTRKTYDTPAFTGYEVILDVYPGVFAYGILLLPKDIQPGEKRPVVVCQHGLEGRPSDVADPDHENPYYHQFACRLAEQGFITYAPQNPYIGGNTFRQALRKAQPLKLTLYSFIQRQHAVTVNWLATLPVVDAGRIGFYGLSYGGKTAMRIPAVLPQYCLSICSADYNEWIWKNNDARFQYGYLWTGEYDMPEFNLGNTFNYAELSWLIFPRPFMVERGHDDGVAPDDWVAYEYANTRRLYVKMGLADRTEIEFFDGPHSIHGVGTFQFLHKHLAGPGR